MRYFLWKLLHFLKLWLKNLPFDDGDDADTEDGDTDDGDDTEEETVDSEEEETEDEQAEDVDVQFDHIGEDETNKEPFFNFVFETENYGC